MKQSECQIILNKKISTDFYLLEFEWCGKIPTAGQFFTAKVSDESEPLLRRPFAFSGFDKTDKTSFIYQVRGKSTKILSRKKKGETIDILGPLGNGFDINSDKKFIIVAGGVGVGPMLYTAQLLKKMGNEPIFIFGSRDSSFVPNDTIFTDANPIVCTDDGSAGIKGTTVDYLNSLPQEELADSTILTCGPLPMQKACHEFAVTNNLECQVSMEEVMACGVGACMGCVVKTVATPGYARACKEGPVFNSRELIWN